MSVHIECIQFVQAQLHKAMPAVGTQAGWLTSLGHYWYAWLLNYMHDTFFQVRGRAAASRRLCCRSGHKRLAAWLCIAPQRPHTQTHAPRLQKLTMRGMPDLEHIGGDVAGLTAIVTGPTRWAAAWEPPQCPATPIDQVNPRVPVPLPPAATHPPKNQNTCLVQHVAVASACPQPPSLSGEAPMVRSLPVKCLLIGTSCLPTPRH